MAYPTTLTLRYADDDRYDRDGRDRDRDRDRDRYSRRDNRGRPAPPPAAPAPTPSPAGGNYAGVPTGPRADRSRAPPTGPSASSTSSPGPSSSSMPPPSLPHSHASTSTPTSTSNHPTSTSTPAHAHAPSDASSTYVPPMTATDLSAIRSRYLGVDKKKRKIRKMNDRKFVFDWDEQEDTFSAEAPLAEGANRQGAQVMFGRGHIAGMDDGGSAGAGGGGGGARGGAGGGRAAGDPNLADPMERRKAAKAGYDDRHWTEKPLDDMKERDWRIFREDFSIAARGWFCAAFGVYTQAG